jgi:bisphosphoglycerate-independent phosphoglycerate mutase (AlkP superfamily)
MTVILVVLDGFGIGDDPKRSAILAARMPNWRRLVAEFPHAQLAASGEAVGLPAGQMGNSEVGHLNLGAGFRVLQDLPRINAAIADGSFFDNEVLVSTCRGVVARRRTRADARHPGETDRARSSEGSHLQGNHHLWCRRPQDVRHMA